MVVGPRRTPAIEEEMGSLTVEPLTWGTTDLMISDRPTTPNPRADPPSLTPNTANPDPNGSGSGSPPQFSPLGNRVIHWVIRLPPHYLNPTDHQPPGHHHRCASFRLDSAVSPVPLLGTRRWGRGGREDGRPLNGAVRMLAVVGGHERGYLDPSTTRSYGDGSRPKKTRKQDSEEGETEDRLTHRRKYGGEYRRAWVRVQP
jgi:hypothetical protein